MIILGRGSKIKLDFDNVHLYRFHYLVYLLAPTLTVSIGQNLCLCVCVHVCV